jgi:hypothetical protein
MYFARMRKNKYMKVTSSNDHFNAALIICLHGNHSLTKKSKLSKIIEHIMKSNYSHLLSVDIKTKKSITDRLRS